MKYKKEKTKTKLQKAFTLLELLLVIAIVASLAGLVLVALNPAGRLEDVSDTKALSSANDLEKAIKVYSIDNSGNLPSALQAITTSGIYDICKSGQTIGCINLDELVTGGKLSSIPEDSRYSSTYKSGYKLDFNPSKSESKVYSQSEYDQATKYCPPGDSCLPPVGEWLFDEGTGSTIRNSIINGSNGTINGSTWVKGYTNGGLQFDGVDDYVQINNPNIDDKISISLWIKQLGTAFFPTVLNYGNSYPFTGFDFQNYGIRMHVNTSITNYQSPAANLIASNWNHIALTYNGQTAKLYVNGVLQNSTNITGNIVEVYNYFRLGSRIGSSYFSNLEMDNLRIYDYARTPEQIAWEYNQGAPIYRYKFDECQGSTATNSAIDANGNLIGNNGTITIGGSGSNISLGTCAGSTGQAWKDGAIGMFNSSIDFDGTDDYIDIANNSNQVNLPLTITAWIKSSTIDQGDWKAIISKYPPSAMNGWNIDSSSGNYYFYYYASSTNKLITGSYGIPFGSASLNWVHLAAVVDSSSAKLYRDGVLVNTQTWAGTAANSTQAANLQIGRIVGNSTFSFSGQVDDIKIYNYALNASQIMQAMHES